MAERVPALGGEVAAGPRPVGGWPVGGWPVGGWLAVAGSLWLGRAGTPAFYRTGGPVTVCILLGDDQAFRPFRDLAGPPPAPPRVPLSDREAEVVR